MVAGVAVAVDLERRPLLISANPAVFLAEASAIRGEAFIAFSRDIKPWPTQERREHLPKLGPLDVIFAGLFYVAFLATCFAWIAVIAPLQYLGNLVAGAPARLALAAPVRTYAIREGKTTYYGSFRSMMSPKELKRLGWLAVPWPRRP